MKKSSPSTIETKNENFPKVRFERELKIEPEGVDYVYSAINVSFPFDGVGRLIVSVFWEDGGECRIQVHNMETMKEEPGVLEYFGIAYNLQYCSKNRNLIIIGAKVLTAGELYSDDGLSGDLMLSSMYFDVYKLRGEKFKHLKTFSVKEHFEEPIFDFLWMNDSIITSLDEMDDENTKTTMCFIENVSTSTKLNVQLVKTDWNSTGALFRRRFTALKLKTEWCVFSGVYGASVSLIIINTVTKEMKKLERIPECRSFHATESFLHSGNERIVGTYTTYQKDRFVGVWKFSGELIRSVISPEKLYSAMYVCDDLILFGGKGATIYSIDTRKFQNEEIKDDQIEVQPQVEGPKNIGGYEMFAHAFAFISYENITFKFLSLNYTPDEIPAAAIYQIKGIVIPRLLKGEDEDIVERMEFVEREIVPNFSVTLRNSSYRTLKIFLYN